MEADGARKEECECECVCTGVCMCVSELHSLVGQGARLCVLLRARRKITGRFWGLTQWADFFLTSPCFISNSDDQQKSG